MKTSVFESRERMYFKRCMEDSHLRVQELSREIEEAKTKDDRQCRVKRYFEYIKSNPILLFEHIGFRLNIIKRIKEERLKMRAERILAHQRYHTKHPRERGSYETELGRHVASIERALDDIEEILEKI